MRRRGGIDQQRRLPVRDAPEVLHGALREVRQGDVIDLRIRIRDAVVLREPVEGVCADLQRERRDGALARHVRHARRHAAGVDRVRQLQVTDHERDEVRRHRHRVREHEPHASVIERRALDLRTVRERRQVGSDDQRDTEHRLEVGLVPRRERATSIRRLEVGRGDDLGAAVGSLIRGAIEPDQLVVQLAAEIQVQRPVTRIRLGVQRQTRALGLRVEPDLRDLDPHAVPRREVSARDVEIDGVHDDLGDRLAHGHGDVLGPDERSCREIGLQHQPVPTGDHGPRQAVSLFVVLGHPHILSGPARSGSAGARRGILLQAPTGNLTHRPLMSETNEGPPRTASVPSRRGSASRRTARSRPSSRRRTRPGAPS